MLSAEDVDLLCRVGPGTPMGTLMRQYWLPVGYAWEYERDGQPQRVRVLGEDLIVWRDSYGKPAFIGENCPHRGVSLFYGRNEESGMRCAYHGWKFDASGQCVDMPNEPAESSFKNKVRTKAYRGADYGGVTWIYMGPQQDDAPRYASVRMGTDSHGEREPRTEDRLRVQLDAGAGRRTGFDARVRPPSRV